MIEYKTITTFRESLKELLKVKKGVYSGVEDEIKKEFKNKTLESILSNRDMVLTQTDSIVIKLRLPDSKNHLSKANGYRLVYLAYKEKELVVFLEIYAKRGPKQMLDLPPNGLKKILDIFENEKSSNGLEVYEIS